MRSEVVNALLEYEKTNPVDTYKLNNWHVWPVLRVMLAYAIHDHLHNIPLSPPPEPLHVAKAVRAFISTCFRNKQYPNTYCGQGKLILPGFSSRTKNADVVIVTNSNRTMNTSEIFYNYISDPIVEHFQEHSLRTVVLETGKQVPSSLPNHLNITKQLETMYTYYTMMDSITRKYATTKEPKWFSDISSWSYHHLGRSLTWYECFKRIRDIEIYSIYLYHLLKKFKCRLVLVDCWYDHVPLSATLAASKLGLITVDIQHGLIDSSHIIYMGWFKIPETGYETIPEYFWTWGDFSKNELLQGNSRAFLNEKDILLGGFPWIEKWVEGGSDEFRSCLKEAEFLTSGYKKIILVTLQHDPSWLDTLLPAIAQSPDDWLWLIRLHRHSTNRMQEIVSKCKALSNSNVEIEKATKLPLYALLRSSDVLVTWYSTCALEVLLFGIPSVLVCQEGFDAYEQFIKQGVMKFCSTNVSLNDTIESCVSIPHSELISAGRSVFATLQVINTTILGFNQILER